MSDERPVTVPDYADKVADQWVYESEVAGKFRRQLWTEAGQQLRIEFWTEDRETLLSLWTTFEAGMLTLELADGWGLVERWETDETLAEGYPTFPHKKVKSIKFRARNIDTSTPQHPTFDASDLVYLNLDEEIVTGEGEPTSERPAWLIALENGEPLDGEPNDEPARDGAWATYYDDDTPELEAIYEDGAVKRFDWSNEAGEWLYWREFGDTEVATIFGSEGTLTFTRTPTSRALHLKSWKGEELLNRTCDLRDLATAEDFVAAYGDFYGDLDEHVDLSDHELDIVLGIGGFAIELAEVRREDEFFAVAVVAENGAGDSLIVIEEPGEFQGRVYVNCHDEGLYDIETIDDYVDGMDEALLADRNGLIEGMPFIYNDVADSLAELFALIDIAPYDDPDFDSMQPAHHGKAP